MPVGDAVCLKSTDVTLTTPFTLASFASFVAFMLPMTSETPFFDATCVLSSRFFACATELLCIETTTVTGAVESLATLLCRSGESLLTAPSSFDLTRPAFCGRLLPPRR